MPAPQFSRLARRAFPALGCAALLASVVVGADLFGTRSALFGSATPGPRAAAVSRASAFQPVETGGTRVRTSLRSSPWWQSVRGARGTGPSLLPAVATSAGAIQVRVRWSCRRGRFTLRGTAAAALIDAPCAGPSTTVLPRRPEGRLRVDTQGPWSARVEQQVDVPLIEPATAAMRSRTATVAGRGAFYRIDQVGQGRLTAYRLGTGRYALRLTDFFVTPNSNLVLRLSPLAHPRSTAEYRRSPSTFAARLDITSGSMNFALPAGVDPRRYRSVVIWCEEVGSAYAAATLEPAR